MYNTFGNKIIDKKEEGRKGAAWEKGGKSLLINLSLELFALLLGSFHQLI
jgi:hypothetical protein